MFKNTTSQKLVVYCFDSATSLPVTGTAANITAYRSLDYGTVTVLGDTSATELDATNAKGYYLFDLTQAETNGDVNTYTAKHSTSTYVVVAVPAVVHTMPANFGATVISSTGVVDANVQKWLGGTIPAVTVTGVPKVDVIDVGGTTVDTTGWPDTYTAVIQWNQDAANTIDQYTVEFYKNAAPCAHGDVTTPFITANKRTDGTVYFTSQSLTEIGTTGAYKYDTTTAGARIGSHEVAYITVIGTIASATRTFKIPIARQS